MIVLWVTLLVLHRGYSLIPVTTVQLGEPVTLMCVLPQTEFKYRVTWYRQSAGDTLQRIWTLKDSAPPEFVPEFTDSRWKISYNKTFSNLTILRTNQEDEGIYHCGFTEWLRDTDWTGTYLLVTGNTRRSNYTVVQEKTDHPGASVTLQCCVINNSDNKTCAGGLSVFWVREGSHASHPVIIYTDGNKHHECEGRSEPQQRCVYRFSKNVSSSDEGTYYCAVATCGEILFGNGAKVPKGGSSEFTALAITTTTISVISMILNIIFICCRTPRAACEPFKKNLSSQARQNDLRQTVDDSSEDRHDLQDLNYAALRFSGTKATRGKKKNKLETDESVYSQVRI